MQPMRLVRFVFWAFALLLGSASCQKDQPTTDSLLGQWDFYGLYYDIGDGSGQFQAFPSGMVLVFEADGAVHSNGPVCLLVSQPVSSSSGRYNETDGTLHFNRCNGFDVDITLTFSRLGDELIIGKSDCNPECSQLFVRHGTKKRS